MQARGECSTLDFSPLLSITAGHTAPILHWINSLASYMTWRVRLLLESANREETEAQRSCDLPNGIS